MMKTSAANRLDKIVEHMSVMRMADGSAITRDNVVEAVRTLIESAQKQARIEHQLRAMLKELL